MLVLILFSFVKGLSIPNEPKSSDDINIYIQFVVQYNDSILKNYGIKIDIPKGTTTKDLPHILHERSLGEHFSVNFLDENGEYIKDIKIILNSFELDLTKEGIVIKPNDRFKLITKVDEESHEKHEL